MSPQVSKLSDVVDWRLCIGCGACAYICPERNVQLKDFLGEGIRPVTTNGASCGPECLCLKVCPAVTVNFGGSAHDNNFTKKWGKVIEIWEGHATDPEVRYQGSSGGALTAISAYCLEKIGMHGVLHIAPDPSDPVRNRTRLSRSCNELMAACGSRYSPASVCDHLEWVEQAPAPCVVIGKPAEIAGLRNAEALRPELRSKVGLILSFFCAETPSTAGTLALLRKMGVDEHSLGELRYRGRGWPGEFAPVVKGATKTVSSMTYRQSWGFLQSFRPWSVQLWPDSTGELADISCGDPWYVEPDGKNLGSSLVVVRTERGRQIIQGAMRDGYLKLSRAEPWKLEKSQGGLIKKKGSIWGRRVALKIMGLPTTRFSGVDLFHCWKQIPLADKFRSVFGTMRRIVTRKLHRRLDLSSGESWSPDSVSKRSNSTPQQHVLGSSNR